MSLHKARAIVLRRLASGEKDLVAEVLLDTGVRRFLRFHGIQTSKKRSPVLAEPGSLIAIDYYEGPGSELSLREGEVIDRFESLKADYRRQDFLARILKLVRLVAAGEPDTAHFVLAESALQYAAKDVVPRNEGDSDPHALEAFLIFLSTRSLLSMGLLGNPDQCGQCGKALASRDRAAWGDGAFFLCSDCSPVADERGAINARIVSAMSRERYRAVRSSIEGLDLEIFNGLKIGLQHAMAHSLPEPPRIFE